MNSYSELTQVNDIPSITLCRTFSPVVKKWLRNFTLLEERIIPASKVEHLLQKMDDELGKLTPEDRVITITQLNKDESENRDLINVLYDTLAAHELGNSKYFGHYETLLNPSRLFPISLDTQFTFNLFVLRCIERLGSFRDEEGLILDKKGVEKELTHSIVVYLHSDWLFELYATVLSQRRRLVDLSLKVQWSEPTKTNLRKFLGAIDSLERGVGPHSLAVNAYKKVEEKFHHKTDDIFNFLLNNTVMDMENLNSCRPDHLLIALLELDAADNIPDEIEKKIDDLFLFSEPKIVNKSTYLKQMLTLRQEDWEVPIQIGNVWLALNSIVYVKHIAEGVGISQMMIKTDVFELLRSIDPNSVKLAMDILKLRNLIMEKLRITIHTFSKRRQNVIQFLNGEIDFKRYMHMCKLRRKAYEEGKYGDILGRIDSSWLVKGSLREFIDLPIRLKKYYISHKREFDRLEKDPSVYYSKIAAST